MHFLTFAALKTITVFFFMHTDLLVSVAALMVEVRFFVKKQLTEK